jgi:DNA-binding Lrp family transcriptional regulator
MRGLDDTDKEILGMLLEDGRRPYSEIADAVGLSAPAVSDRIDRLQDIGLIRRFTVDIDRGLLREGTPVLITIDGKPGDGDRLYRTLTANDTVEYAFRTADDRVVCTAALPDGAVEDLFDEEFPVEAVQSYDVSLLEDSTWTPTLEDADLAPECVECGNTVTTEGEREQFDSETYHFCCSSCLATFRDRYETLNEGL